MSWFSYWGQICRNAKDATRGLEDRVTDMPSVLSEPLEWLHDDSLATPPPEPAAPEEHHMLLRLVAPAMHKRGEWCHQQKNSPFGLVIFGRGARLGATSGERRESGLLYNGASGEAGVKASQRHRVIRVRVHHGDSRSTLRGTVAVCAPAGPMTNQLFHRWPFTDVHGRVGPSRDYLTYSSNCTSDEYESLPIRDREVDCNAPYDTVHSCLHSTSGRAYGGEKEVAIALVLPVTVYSRGKTVSISAGRTCAHLHCDLSGDGSRFSMCILIELGLECSMERELIGEDRTRRESQWDRQVRISMENHDSDGLEPSFVFVFVFLFVFAFVLAYVLSFGSAEVWVWATVPEGVHDRCCIVSVVVAGMRIRRVQAHTVPLTLENAEAVDTGKANFGLTEPSRALGPIAQCRDDVAWNSIRLE
ncbi:uncharacterized protein STEHIDRAFT_114014 [Stereum hirsutum FP-91666 SS1]|uniref:uncharacterized protein n=1 Tax=Stereum hirsutum (strain FP-91666) TaxID=721885 RepID=UPI0004449C42|nr:uncharacterized protein STEHIDRAFT_114014 [Stereum hirsutum FP-91666 SS1]EIM82948.1 hypothetical protein STEHIDRAFT_114014 [Stereum hirsutum FP-91666 SS1]